MKTITEFSGFQLSAALKKLAELTAAGKTPEEQSLAFGEEYKMEGDKLKFFVNALDVMKSRAENLKRVVLMTLNEGEKAPQGAVEKEGHQYICEYFFIPSSKKEGRRGGKGGRFDGKGDGKKKGRGGRGGDSRRDKGSRPEARNNDAKEAGGRGPNPRRDRNENRPPRENTAPKVNNPLVIDVSALPKPKPKPEGEATKAAGGAAPGGERPARPPRGDRQRNRPPRDGGGRGPRKHHNLPDAKNAPLVVLTKNPDGTITKTTVLSTMGGSTAVSVGPSSKDGGSNSSPS